MEFKLVKLKVTCLVFCLALSASALNYEIVGGNVSPVCSSYELKQDLRIIGLFSERGKLPVISTLSGTVGLRWLDDPKPLREFSALYSYYGVEPRGADGHPLNGSMLARAAQVCSDAYNGTFGVVILNELEIAQRSPDAEIGLPPSTPGHPIPVLKEPNKIAELPKPNKGR